MNIISRSLWLGQDNKSMSIFRRSFWPHLSIHWCNLDINLNSDITDKETRSFCMLKINHHHTYLSDSYQHSSYLISILRLWNFLHRTDKNSHLCMSCMVINSWCRCRFVCIALIGIVMSTCFHRSICRDQCNWDILRKFQCMLYMDKSMDGNLNC